MVRINRAMYTDFLDEIYPYVTAAADFTPVEKPAILLVEDLGGHEYKGMTLWTSLKEGNMVRPKCVIPKLLINLNDIDKDMITILGTSASQSTMESFTKVVILHELIHYVDLSKILAIGTQFLNNGYMHEPYMLTIMNTLLDNYKTELMDKHIFTEKIFKAIQVDLAVSLIHQGRITKKEWCNLYAMKAREIESLKE